MLRVRTKIPQAVINLTCAFSAMPDDPLLDAPVGGAEAMRRMQRVRRARIGAGHIGGIHLLGAEKRIVSNSCGRSQMQPGELIRPVGCASVLFRLHARSNSVTELELGIARGVIT
jgi:hypothetical protein